MDLNWKQVIRTVRRAQGLLVWPVTDHPIDSMLNMSHGVDVADRRQLNYLLQCLELFAPVMAEMAMDTNSNDFFGLDEEQANAFAFGVLQSWAVLTLKLSEHLPAEVRSGRLKRERIYAPPIDPTTLNWSGVAPRPAQLEHYNQWQKDAAAREAPGHVAKLDQADAQIRDCFRDGLFAYMSIVACSYIGLLAAVSLYPDGPAPEGVQRFQDVVITTVYNSLPREYQALGSAE